jgi:CheY-like chemotaxis protein
MNEVEQARAPRGDKARVLVVDNDPEVRESNVTKLRYWDYEPVAARGTGRALLEDAVEQARAWRCQLATVDLHLIDDHDHADWSGLELIRELMPTRSVIHSGSVNYRTVRDALSNSLVLAFVGKSESPEYLREVLDRHAAAHCACRHPVRIEWPGSLSSAEVARLLFPDTPGVPEDEAADLLVRLFPKASVLQLDYLGSHRPASPSLPRPRSIVLKAREDGNQPVIVKLARAQKMEQEVEKYELYVRRRLGGNFYPILEESSLLWDIGGAVYSFLGSADEIVPFSKFYTSAEARTKHVVDSLGKFFNQMWLPHYGQKALRAESSLAKLYFSVWYGDWWLKRLDEHSQAGRVTAALGCWPGWQRLGLPEPVRWLHERIEQEMQGEPVPFRVAVTHGDLHSENLLVDTGSHNAWVIDFERTGYGHIVQDFVELEGDLLTHLAADPGEDYDRLYALFVCAAAPTRLGRPSRVKTGDTGLGRCMAVLRFLRRTAAEVTGVEDGREYLYGLLLNTLFRAMMLLNAGGPPARLLPPLMLAAILCHRLDHWQETWPPPAWPLVPLRNSAR